MDTFLTSKRVGAGEFGDFARQPRTRLAEAANLGMHGTGVAGVFGQ